MPNAARPKVTNTAMGGNRQPGPLLKLDTECDDYFRTSASLAASIRADEVEAVMPTSIERYGRTGGSRLVAHIPPSTTRIWPFTNDEAGDAKN